MKNIKKGVYQQSNEGGAAQNLRHVMKLKLAVIIISISFTNCVSIRDLPVYRSPEISGGSFIYEMEILNTEPKFPIVEIKGNNSSGLFLIDTGAERSVIFELDYFNTVKVLNSDKIFFPFVNKLANGHRVEINSWEVFPGFSINQFKVFHTNEIIRDVIGSDKKIIGILGLDFLMGCQVFFKNSENKLILSRGSSYNTRKIPSFQPGKSWIRLPALIMGTNYGPIFKNLMIDTGAPGGFYLNEDDVEALKIPPEENGEFEITVFPYDEYRFNRIITWEKTHMKSSLVGNKLLSSFDWGLDISSGEFLLSPKD